MLSCPKTITFKRARFSITISPLSLVTTDLYLGLNSGMWKSSGSYSFPSRRLMSAAPIRHTSDSRSYVSELSSPDIQLSNGVKNTAGYSRLKLLFSFITSLYIFYNYINVNERYILLKYSEVGMSPSTILGISFSKHQVAAYESVDSCSVFTSSKLFLSPRKLPCFQSRPLLRRIDLILLQASRFGIRVSGSRKIEGRNLSSSVVKVNSLGFT